MNKKQAIVISAFPGCGKTYYFNHHRDDIKVLDSDSSQFSWIYHEDGTKERNPDFPNNYIQHIKDNMDKQDIIFVSSHEQVRQALYGNIPFVLVFPMAYMKDEWRKRLIDRGSPIEFVKLIMDNWDNWIRGCIDDELMCSFYYRLTREHPYLDEYVISRICFDDTKINESWRKALI